MVFYRPGLFDDRMLLDQSWALDAIYALFTREGGVYRTLRRLGGRFTPADLDALLWHTRCLSDKDQASLLEMMQISGICFEHRRDCDQGETEYVAPDLLPEGRDSLADDLAARWDPLPGAPRETSFEYPLLSPTIARSVLSDLGSLARTSAIYWRYGLCLYDAATRAGALVEAAPNAEGYGGQVRVKTKGDDAKDLLERLVERIAQLDERSGWGGRGPAGRTFIHREVAAPPIDPAPSPVRPPAKPEVYVSYA